MAQAFKDVSILAKRITNLTESIEASIDENKLEFGDFILGMTPEDMKEHLADYAEWEACVAAMRATATKMNAYYDEWYQSRLNRVLQELTKTPEGTLRLMEAMQGMSLVGVVTKDEVMGSHKEDHEEAGSEVEEVVEVDEALSESEDSFGSFDDPIDGFSDSDSDSNSDW